MIKCLYKYDRSAQQFLATMSAPRSRPLLPSTYIRNVPYYEIQKCQLMVTKIELFSLWLIVCSLSRETQSLKFLLRVRYVALLIELLNVSSMKLISIM